MEESYPHITPIGCAAHALNLLLKDIMQLKTMDTLYNRAKEMVRFVKGHQVIAAIYLTKQSEKNKSTTLKLPSNTFWGGVVILFEMKWPAPSGGSSWIMYFGREWKAA